MTITQIVALVLGAAAVTILREWMAAMFTEAMADREERFALMLDERQQARHAEAMSLGVPITTNGGSKEAVVPITERLSNTD